MTNPSPRPQFRFLKIDRHRRVVMGTLLISEAYADILNAQYEQEGNQYVLVRRKKDFFEPRQDSLDLFPG